MAIKPFVQVFPGQNDPNLKPKKGKEVDPQEWERKQRMKEYRIAARREKRNRKSDEKKQRKLNATILRRMTRNPAKYTKNAGRNRLRAIEQERRKIQHNAIQMAQRLAAIHDPSGVSFNVKPVTILEDGRVATLESIERKKQREAEKAAKERGEAMPQSQSQINGVTQEQQMKLVNESHGIDPTRLKLLVENNMTQQQRSNGLSKTQQKKLEMFAPKPPPPKPTIPEGVELPPDEEENWLELWSLPDEELERRVLRAKRHAARERKELRIKQKTGKAERRAARDEKRRVYREIKQSWKVLRQRERDRRKVLETMEDEERKKLAVQVANMRRKEALDVCAELGFTLENVEGIDEIKPKALGMKGVEVPFDKLEVVGSTTSGLRLHGMEEKRGKGTSQKIRKSNRIDLSKIAPEDYAQTISATYQQDAEMKDNVNFVKLGSSNEGHDHEQLNFNHRLRRKLRRAIESAQIKKELLVREKAIAHCEEKGISVPAILHTSAKPANVRGQRTMPDGQLETAKQERVRARVELTEFNKMAKVLRSQAKDAAIEAGIRIYLELTGRIPKREGFDEFFEQREKDKLRAAGVKVDEMEVEDEGYGGEEGMPMGGIWPAQSTQTMAQLLASFPMPEDENADGRGDGEELAYNAALDGNGAEARAEEKKGDVESSEDSAARQVQGEMAKARANGIPNEDETDDDDDDEEDEDTDMSDA